MALGIDFISENHQLIFYGIFVIICTCTILHLSLRSFEVHSKLDRSNEFIEMGRKRPKRPKTASTSNSEWASMRELEFYKKLYFKLQNLEEHPEIIPIARQVFLALLSEALEDYSKAPNTNILSMKHFDKGELALFLQSHQDNVTDQYHHYISRRQSGGQRALFQDHQEAEDWLRKIAPLKLVDGAWLGHLNKITMPFSLRPIVKETWQVFTEELGNGNRDQHHVKIFEDLLREFEPDLPSPTTKSILHPRYKLGNLKYWRAAVAQLIVSLFPCEFFPEILGFNMHFESLQLDTMQAAKELPEVHLDAYYFLLHVSIDNGHSGHAAMAMEGVAHYIQHISETEGGVAAETAWRRIQAGYVFSEWQFRNDSQVTNIFARLNDSAPDKLEPKVLSIFSSKIQAAHRLHCGSRVKIGKRSLAEWLEPESFLAEEWQNEFLQSLSTCKPWVYPGNSQRSKLAQELRWGGKMYGAFTKSELEIFELWINSMGSDQPHFYYSFIDSNPHAQFHIPRTMNLNMSESKVLATRDENFETAASIPSGRCCLLESFVYSPGRTTDAIGCAVVRFLRAQSGFDEEDSNVTGIDEPRTAENGGIVEFGLEMIRRASLPTPQSLYNLLSHWPSEFAMNMLSLSSSPIRNFGVLLGMSMAFLELQEMVSESSDSSLLSPKSGERLASLARRQYLCLQICLQDIPTGDERRVDFGRGYDMAKAEIKKCFSQEV
ncbi:unnamed protein product [Penicillium pancosmium]